MFSTLPTDHSTFMAWIWRDLEPLYSSLEQRALDPETIDVFLREWTAVTDRVTETRNRLETAVDRNTADEDVARRLGIFLATVWPPAQQAEQRLRQKFLACGLKPEGIETPLRSMRVEVDLFREANLPLFARENELQQAYSRTMGAQTVRWQGQDITPAELLPVYQDPSRRRREQAWRLENERRLADAPAVQDLWRQLLALRLQQAKGAGFASYREYRWRRLLRFDYTPEDCLRFHAAIEEWVSPVIVRLHEERRRQLGIQRLRPWDLQVDMSGQLPLRPFADTAELAHRAGAIVHAIDPELGAYVDIMVHENLLDLEGRPHKTLGGYCTDFPLSRRPFILLNAVGIERNVPDFFHELGHAFLSFETAHLPYRQQRFPGAEFDELAAMTMELLAAPYLDAAGCGFYDAADATRARRCHLEQILLRWPAMAMMDAFQHWVYENPDAAADPVACGTKWQSLWLRFLPGVDWSELEEYAGVEWQRRLHLFLNPFYYVEYGLAQLGAVQIWAKARHDPGKALARYRQALSLGGTLPLPALYEAAGATFAFDEHTLREAVDVIQEIL